MPYTTLVAGTTITAAWANANVRDQTISPFATNVARAAAVTAPVNGQHVYITGTRRLEVYTGSLFQPIAGDMPRAFGFRSASMTVPTSTLTVVTWNSEEYDTDAIHDTAAVTSRFTVPTGMAGTWFVSYSLAFDPSGTGIRNTFLQTSAGARRYAEQTHNASGASNQINTGSAMIVMAAAEYVELWAFQDSGSTLSVCTTTNNYMQAYYMGPN